MRAALVMIALVACSSSTKPGDQPDAATGDGPVVPPCTRHADRVRGEWEQTASDRFDALLADPAALAAFLKAVPKGGDLHNHLTGAVYAETYLDWAQAPTATASTRRSYSAVVHEPCSASNAAGPDRRARSTTRSSRAWSMQDFVAGARERPRSLLRDVRQVRRRRRRASRRRRSPTSLTRAADENELYVETMFNLGKNVGTLAASVWSRHGHRGRPADALRRSSSPNAGFATALTNDVAVVDVRAAPATSNALGCVAATRRPPRATSACASSRRSRAPAPPIRSSASSSARSRWRRKTDQIVGVEPLLARGRLRLARELRPPHGDARLPAHASTPRRHEPAPRHAARRRAVAAVPAGRTAPRTRSTSAHAVETGHAERIGHGLDIAVARPTPTGLLAEMADEERARRGLPVEQRADPRGQRRRASARDRTSRRRAGRARHRRPGRLALEHGRRVPARRARPAPDLPPAQDARAQQPRARVPPRARACGPRSAHAGRRVRARPTRWRSATRRARPAPRSSRRARRRRCSGSSSAASSCSRACSRPSSSQLGIR